MYTMYSDMARYYRLDLIGDMLAVAVMALVWCVTFWNARRRANMTDEERKREDVEDRSEAPLW